MVQPAVTFNQGIYTPAEIALFTKLHRSTVRRWFYGDNKGTSVIPPTNAEEKVMSFWDFVQAMAIRSIRRNSRVSLHKIREAIVRAENDYGMSNIFARPHCTVLFSGDIFIYPKEGDSPVQLTGKLPHQMAIRPVVEPYQRDLSFDGEGLANLFTAFRFANQQVVIDPTVRFGEPYVPSCGYSARTLYDAVLSEGGVTEAAKSFGVEEYAIEVAFRYYESLDTAA